MLEPLTIEHAGEMVDVLAPSAIYDHIGGVAPTVTQLTERYKRQVVGHSGDGQEGWMNWIVRTQDSGEAVGFTQATLANKGGVVYANVAWVISPVHQGRGFATDAARIMCDWLRSQGVELLVANISPANVPSVAVARNLGLHATETITDGETRWES